MLIFPSRHFGFRENIVYVKPTAPRSIGGVLDDAIQLYRSAFASSWAIALLGQVVLSVPAFIIGARLKAVAVPGNPMAMLAVYKSPAVWIPYLIAGIFLIGINNALLLRADAIAAGKAGTAGQSAAAGFRLLPRTLLLFFAIMIAFAVCGLIVGVLSFIVSGLPVVRAICLLALALAAVYAGWRIFLANTALVVNDAAVFKSLEISWTLIKDHWWRSATVYTVAIIIAMVFYFVIAFLSGIVIALLHGSEPMTTVISQVIGVAGGTILMAFIPAVVLAIFYDLRLRKDGADLASRVNALAQK
jgi:hypothetical protein